MAYTKNTWACGDEITAEKLNHMEDGIENAGGFECEVTKQVLTDETVTTSMPSEGSGVSAFAALSYTGVIDADEIKVTFDGTEYTCQKNNAEGANAYGGVGASGPDFSVYPFVILSASGMGNQINTQTAGTYTVKIEAVQTTVETTDCFEKAVQSAAPILRVPFEFVDSINGAKSTVLASEVDKAIANGYFIFGTFTEDGTTEYWRFIKKTSASVYQFQTPGDTLRCIVTDDGYLAELAG